MKQQKIGVEETQIGVETLPIASDNSLRVTEFDLRSGAVSRVKELDFCRITGISQSTARRDRVKGQGLPFVKEKSGRIYYRATDILKLLDSAQLCRSTSEYDTERYQLNLAKAREAAKSSRESGATQVCA